MASSRLLIQGIADVTIVHFNDASVLDPVTIQKIAEELYDLVDNRDKRKIVLDFSNVRFLSSSAIGVLLTLKKKADAIKGRVALCAVRPEIEKVFKITSLHRLFSFYPDESKATSGFDAHVN